MITYCITVIFIQIIRKAKNNNYSLFYLKFIGILNFLLFSSYFFSHIYIYTSIHFKYFTL